MRALRRPLYNYRTGRVTAEVARAAGARQAGREAAEAARRFGKDTFERTALGQAAKTYNDVRGYDRVSEAVEEIGKLKAKEVAERGVAETALDKLLEERYKQELKERTK